MIPALYPIPIFRYTTSNVILALVGNKSDLVDERQVEDSEVNSMKDIIPEIMFCIETSAKENTNIEKLFYNIAKELKDRTDMSQVDEEANQNIRLSDGKSIKNSKCTNFCNGHTTEE